MPNELKDLTWIEELLIVRAHVVGRVVRLQARNQASYFGIKGHPQDTALLLDVLPMTPASLPDVVRVVWTGNPPPIETDSVRCSQFAGTLCIMLCNSYVQRGLPTGHHRSQTMREVAAGVRYHWLALTLPYARTNFKAQHQTMFHGAVPDLQQPARGEVAIDTVLCPTFACHFPRHAIHS